MLLLRLLGSFCILGSFCTSTGRHFQNTCLPRIMLLLDRLVIYLLSSYRCIFWYILVARSLGGTSVYPFPSLCCSSSWRYTFCCFLFVCCRCFAWYTPSLDIVTVLQVGWCQDQGARSRKKNSADRNACRQACMHAGNGPDLLWRWKRLSRCIKDAR